MPIGSFQAGFLKIHFPIIGVLEARISMRSINDKSLNGIPRLRISCKDMQRLLKLRRPVM